MAVGQQIGTIQEWAAEHLISSLLGIAFSAQNIASMLGSVKAQKQDSLESAWKVLFTARPWNSSSFISFLESQRCLHSHKTSVHFSSFFF